MPLIYKLIEDEPYVDEITAFVDDRLVAQAKAYIVFDESVSWKEEWSYGFEFKNERDKSHKYEPDSLNSLLFDFYDELSRNVYPLWGEEKEEVKRLKVEFYRKGALVATLESTNETVFSVIDFYEKQVLSKYVLPREVFELPMHSKAMASLSSNLELVDYGDNEELKRVDEGSCFQVGCSNEAVSTFKMKNIAFREKNDLDFVLIEPQTTTVRKFCRQHLDRYNGAYLDSRSNMELIEGELDWSDAEVVRGTRIQEKRDGNGWSFATMEPLDTNSFYDESDSDFDF